MLNPQNEERQDELIESLQCVVMFVHHVSDNDSLQILFTFATKVLGLISERVREDKLIKQKHGGANKPAAGLRRSSQSIYDSAELQSGYSAGHSEARSTSPRVPRYAGCPTI
eukprot:139957-Amphidinium_carterae.4